jgi:hypothetical protein
LRILKNAMLLMVMPIFWWGPMAHPYINKLALKKARSRLDSGDERINADMVKRLEAGGDHFLYAGNSADAVSSCHVLNNIAIYDYAHNAIPNRADGIPHFGYTLIDEWLQATAGNRPGTAYDDRDFAVACGWLAHQLADWYPHYASVDQDGDLVEDGRAAADEFRIFTGFANSHRVLGSDYYPEILANYVQTDHALLEFFYDLLILNNNPDESNFFAQNRVSICKNRLVHGHWSNLLTATSERYLGTMVRIPPEHVPALEKSFNNVIGGIQCLLEMITSLRPSVVKAVQESLDPQANRGTDYLDLSVERVVNELFCKSYAEISRLVNRPLNVGENNPWAYKYHRPGSIIYPLVNQLGQMSNPQKLLPFLRNKGYVAIPFNCGLIKNIRVPARWLRPLITPLEDGIWRLLPKTDQESDALFCYFRELLSEDHQDLDIPLKKFKKNLQPAVALDAGLKVDQEATLEQMITERELRLRLAPATSPSQAELDKLLDPKKLLFRVDGYDVRDNPAAYTLEGRWEGALWHLTCKLLDPQTEVKHLFVDIHDLSDMHSRYLEYER